MHFNGNFFMIFASESCSENKNCNHKWCQSFDLFDININWGNNFFFSLCFSNSVGVSQVSFSQWSIHLQPIRCWTLTIFCSINFNTSFFFDTQIINCRWFSRLAEHEKSHFFSSNVKSIAWQIIAHWLIAVNSSQVSPLALKGINQRYVLI